MEKLKVPVVTDEDVLEVLRLWHFKSNRSRTNVFPDGANFVHSDTLGAIRNRSGKVVPTAMTIQHPPVFAMLSRWLEDNTPDVFSQPFTFTSVNVNFGYAARPHRDQYNVGPSMTKAIGRFTGGQLVYWQHDDGSMDVATADRDAGRKYDTRREMVLFDGNRCHAVAPFEGERYSLVFFTCPGYHGMATSNKQTLIDIGAVWPDEESKAYWASLLGPPTGNCKNIRELFGYKEKPGAIQIGGTSLLKLENAAVVHVLSFVVEPLFMHIFCACSRGMSAAAWKPTAWEDVLVDTAIIRPMGARAHVHFKLWKQAHVIPGSWAYTSRT